MQEPEHCDKDNQLLDVLPHSLSGVHSAALLTASEMLFPAGAGVVQSPEPSCDGTQVLPRCCRAPRSTLLPVAGPGHLSTLCLSVSVFISVCFVCVQTVPAPLTVVSFTTTWPSRAGSVLHSGVASSLGARVNLLWHDGVLRGRLCCLLQTQPVCCTSCMLPPLFS